MHRHSHQQHSGYHPPDIDYTADHDPGQQFFYHPPHPPPIPPPGSSYNQHHQMAQVPQGWIAQPTAAYFVHAPNDQVRFRHGYGYIVDNRMFAGDRASARESPTAESNVLQHRRTVAYNEVARVHPSDRSRDESRENSRGKKHRNSQGKKVERSRSMPRAPIQKQNIPTPGGKETKKGGDGLVARIKKNTKEMFGKKPASGKKDRQDGGGMGQGTSADTSIDSKDTQSETSKTGSVTGLKGILKTGVRMGSPGKRPAQPPTAQQPRLMAGDRMKRFETLAQKNRTKVIEHQRAQRLEDFHCVPEQQLVQQGNLPKANKDMTSTLSDPETGIGAKPIQVQLPPADESAHIWGTNGKDIADFKQYLEVKKERSGKETDSERNLSPIRVSRLSAMGGTVKLPNTPDNFYDGLGNFTTASTRAMASRFEAAQQEKEAEFAIPPIPRQMSSSTSTMDSVRIRNSPTFQSSTPEPNTKRFGGVDQFRWADCGTLPTDSTDDETGKNTSMPVCKRPRAPPTPPPTNPNIYTSPIRRQQQSALSADALASNTYNVVDPKALMKGGHSDPGLIQAPTSVMSSGSYGTYISNSATTSIRANLSFIKNEPTDADAEESSQNSSFTSADYLFNRAQQHVSDQAIRKDSSSDVGSTEDVLHKTQMKADLWKFQDKEKKLQEELGKLTDKVAQLSNRLTAVAVEMEQLRKDGDELTKAGKEPTSEMVEGIFP
ncbi:hypothetical protein WR25_19179 isoform B [Diploscapter pachys]|uniref:Uncharacterized protein n=1 Tax=Diploscapter pachys TaxID=2018661 RepID=A0A2A2JEZ0_9BILA|nr:hypothetical protein WR25_19179 isoform B [Diploscapter pachys]